MKTQLRWILVATAAGVMLLSGCTDEDDPDDGDLGTAAPTVATPATTPAGGTASPTAAAAGEEADEDTIEDRLDSIVDSYNSGDPEEFTAHFTDEGLASFAEAPPGTSREEIESQVGAFIGEDEVEIREVLDFSASGATAAATVEFSLGRSIGIDEVEFTRVDDEWLVSNWRSGVASPQIPEGVEAVPVSMVDFAFAIQGEIPEDGEVAFELSNDGQQAHEFVLLRVDEGVDVLEALRAFNPETGEDPEGVEFFAAGFVEEPGGETNLVLTEALSAGRWAAVCFLPDVNDPEETPHAFKGMITEFEIE